MKVYDRLAEAFKAEGTTAVFGIMGDANMYWYSELDKLGVQLVEVRHEGAGLGMADGWARATHKPGIASVPIRNINPIPIAIVHVCGHCAPATTCRQPAAATSRTTG